MTERVRSGRRAARGALLISLLLVSVAGAQNGEAPLSVAVLGPEESAPGGPARPYSGGQLTLRPPGAPGVAGTSPALAVIVDGRARVLVDPVAGTLAAARTARVDLGQVRTVLLGSMQPADMAELPVLFTDRSGPAGAVRLVAPPGGEWPAPRRWAGALFGPEGLYRGVRSAPRSLRLSVVELTPAAERRVALGDGLQLRARVTAVGQEPAAAFRLTRGGAALVIAGEVAPGVSPGLTALAQDAALLVARCPTLPSVRALAELARAARPGTLLITAAGDEVRAGLDEVRRTLEGAAPAVVWSASGRHAVTAPAPVPLPAPPGRPPVAACQSDQDCGPGRLCLGCGEDTPRECVAGCRSSADCPSGQKCVPVTCVRCPCPSQCTGG